MAACLAAGCGQLRSTTISNHQTTGTTVGSDPVRARPQAIQPVAGAAPSAGTSADSPVTGQRRPAHQRRCAATANLAPKIRTELAASGLSANTNQATLTPDGLALAPIGAPAAVQAIIDAGNQIAHLPYRFGGGHGTYEDTAYDCSGSLSFVLSAAGLLNTTVTSGELMSWGAAGPGKWVTIFANDGHTFMYVAGLRFDTVALAEYRQPLVEPLGHEGGGFVARHPQGL